MTTPFCANPACTLHVSPDDPRVAGHGEWACADGVWRSRSRYQGRLLCDLCGRSSRGGEQRPSNDTAAARVVHT